MSFGNIGPYKIVKLGTHKKTKQKVAIKIIQKKDISNSPDLLEKVRREIAVQRLIKHPNVLRIHNVYETNENLFIILEYVPGGELFDYIVKRGSIPREEARFFFQQIIFAIDYCHSFLITHRDLKPENLLLDEHNNVKIADFGMARIMHKNTLLETSCGSPHYASPEVIKGVAYDGKKSDTWSCGVILYALLCGYLPFDDDNYSKLLKKVKLGKCKFPNTLLKSEKELIKGMLTVNPKRRITIKKIKNHTWFKENYPTGFIPPLPPVNFEIDLTKPIYSKKIEKKILQNLIDLNWGTKEEIIEFLEDNEPNVIKVFYNMYNNNTIKKKNQNNKKRRRRGSLPPNAKIAGNVKNRLTLSFSKKNQNYNNVSNTVIETKITPMDLVVIQEVIDKTENNQEIDLKKYSEFLNKVGILDEIDVNVTQNGSHTELKIQGNNEKGKVCESKKEKESEKEKESGSGSENENENENENKKEKEKQEEKEKENKPNNFSKDGSSENLSIDQKFSKNSHSKDEIIKNEQKNNQKKEPQSNTSSTGLFQKNNRRGKRRRWSFNRNKVAKNKRTKSLDQPSKKKLPRRRASSYSTRPNLIKNKIKNQKKSWFGKFLEKKKKNKKKHKLHKKLIQVREQISENLQLLQNENVDIRDDRILSLSDKSLFEIISQLQQSLTILNLQWNYNTINTLYVQGNFFKAKIKIKQNSMKKETERRKYLEFVNSNKKMKKKFKNNNFKKTQNDRLINEIQKNGYKKKIIHFIWKEGTAIKFKDEIINLIQLSKI
ncbi:protein kinase [Anaeramoeba flamelloides]|uniref:Protein kinase n=1 Tax=Anaeramoeba flamelloides TaxID=1746091 RepID=A0AAV7ZAC1_9EUKA|nr:protein kinase [Anaeramoeba flamelloides]